MAGHTKFTKSWKWCSLEELEAAKAANAGETAEGAGSPTRSSMRE